MQPFGRYRYGPKIWWGLCPFGGGGAGSPSNTMWPGPRPTCMPSFILIRATVWPQYTNITDRTDRQDNGPIAQGKPFYKRSPKNRTITQTQQIKMHIFNLMQVNLIYNMNCNLFLWIKIFISTMDLYNTTADRRSCHLPNMNKQRTCLCNAGSVPLHSDIKGMELPPANILIPLERQLTALQLCCRQFLYNETLQQTFRPLLSKLSERRQI